mmetsp:Transcript_58774/g.108494  ORF Transcript_58774/g.108494 Transcript_58774/m.108494 type:complete len:328 (+) Transcript_58774:85-1068(+)
MATQTFEAASALAAFLADPTQMTLELPPMSAAQRREVKQLAAQYPELRCESYGFGAERQLHLFKPSTGNSQGAKVSLPSDTASNAGEAEQHPPVRVRNTFIDGWICNEADAEEAEPVIFRSMPPQLNTDSVTEAQSRQGVHWCEKPGSPTHSTTASSASRTSSPCPAGNCTQAEATEATAREVNNNLQVRNTFVHFEESAPTDPRIVQSMPHGMFRKSLAEELAEAPPEAVGGEALPPQATASSFPSAVVRPILEAPQVPPVLQALIGMEVQVTGLVKTPAFNGHRGLVYSWDTDVARYNVLLSLPTGPQWAKVKWENLLLLGGAAR